MSKLHRIVMGDEEFNARSGQRLLDAALESGIEMPHDCRAGRCGACLTRVRRGTTLGGNSPIEGAIHACQAMVFSDLELEPEDRPEIVTSRAMIEAITEIGREIVEVVLLPRKPIVFLPGQYGKFSFRGLPPRAFSPTAPLDKIREDGRIRLNIKRVRRGLVTPRVGTSIAKGHSVRIEGPLGSAYLRRGERGRLILIGGGTGFAPVWSIATAALKENSARPIVILASARSRDAFYMAPALRLVSRFPNVTVVACIDDPREAGSGFKCGGPLRHLPPLMSTDFVYAAGAPALVTAAGACADKVRATFYADPFDLGPQPESWLERARVWLGASPAEARAR